MFRCNRQLFYSIILLGVWGHHQILAAQGKVVGFVVDSATNQPMAGANVLLDSTHLGAVTDATGYFKINNVPKGDYSLVTSMLGYRKMIVQHVQVGTGIRALRVKLNRTPIPMANFDISAKRTPPNFEYQAALAGHEMIEPRIVHKRAGAMEDAYRALKAVPGVVNRNDMNTQLYIRGSSPDQNLILYDGVEVTNPNRLLVMMGGGISLVNPDIVQAMDLAPAGFEVDHGNKMSALLQIANREGSREELKFNASVTMLTARATAEGPLAGGSGSWLMACRRSFYDLAANALSGGKYVFPFYYDVHAKLAYDFSSQYKLTAFYTYLGEGAKMLNVESEQLDLLNAGKGQIAGLRLTSMFSPKWVGHFFVGAYTDQNDINIRDTYFYRYQVRLNYQLQRQSLRSDLYYYPADWLHFKFGAEANRHSTKLQWKVDWRNTLDLPTQIDFDADGVHEAGYGEVRVKVKKSCEWILGSRYDYSTLYRQGHVNPRAKLLITAFSPASFWLSYGRYSQFPDFLTIIGRGEPMDISQHQDQLAAEQATHAILGGQWRMSERTVLKCEWYRKQFSDLLVNEEDYSFAPTNDGQGLSQGIEFSLQKQRLAPERWGFWLNYTRAETKYRRNGSSSWIYFEYDQTHQVNMGLETRLSSRWSMDWVWYYGSGFPFTPVQGAEDGDGTTFSQVIKGEKNSGRYPYYSRLDLRLAYEHAWGRRKLTAYLDVVNVLNRRNVYIYDWRLEEGGALRRNVYYMLPLVPSVGLSVSL